MLITDSQQTLIAILPDHLIIENILPRLPAKSLIRFKIVCKLWLSIISSIHFAKSHLKFSSLCPIFVVLFEEYGCYKLWLLDYDENNNGKELVRLDLDENWVFTEINLVGCCNGLICFHLQVADDNDYFCVWNPLTRESRKIIGPSDQLVAIGYGFSYASSIDDYKIVAPFYGDGSSDCVYYFSLRSGKWKRIPGMTFTGATKFRDSLLLFHWTKNLEYWKDGECIPGFDLVDEKWKEIPVMNWLTRYCSVGMLAVKECASLFCRSVHGSGVWVLKQYGDWNSWEIMFSFNLGVMDFCNITETGKCLFQGWDRVKIVDLRPDGPDESGVFFYFSGNFCGSEVYVGSFISPFIPSSEANQD